VVDVVAVAVVVVVVVVVVAATELQYEGACCCRGIGSCLHVNCSRDTRNSNSNSATLYGFSPFFIPSYVLELANTLLATCARVYC